MADIRRTGLLDDFERAVHESVVLPPWYVMEGHLSPEIGGSEFVPNNLHSVTSSAWMDRRIHGPDCELWARQGEGPDITESQSVGLMQDPHSISTRKGYAISNTDSIGGDGTSLDRFDNGVVTVLDDNVPTAANTLHLLRIEGDLVQGWVSTDDGANWELRLEAVDTTHRNDFYPWLRCSSDDGAGPTWLDLGGGTLNTQHEYRYFPGLYDYPLGRTKEHA